MLENLKMGAYTRTDKRADRGAASSACTACISRSWPSGAPQLAGTLSGGEQQMLAIGRGADGRAPADAPRRAVAGAGAHARRGDLRASSATIHAGGTTVLLVEQNANKALSIADYGYVLETGTIALAGDSQQLLRDDRVRRSYLGHR